MKTVCPACTKTVEVQAGYAGLVACACGTRYDGFAHPQKITPHLGRNAISTIVTFTDHTRGGSPGVEKPVRRNAVMVWCGAIAALFGAIFFGAYQMKLVGFEAAAPAHVSVPAGPANPVAMRNDVRQIALSEVELNAMTAQSYFLRANIKNAGTGVADWPLIEVTFSSGGKDVAQKVILPLEYLAGQVTAGHTPAPSMSPGKSTSIWTSINLPADVGNTENYRVRPLYKEEPAK